MTHARHILSTASSVLLVAALACGGDGTTDPPDGDSGDPAGPASVSVAGATSVDIAGTAQLTAQPRTSGGAAVDTGVTWSSSNTALATVNASGVVAGAARGTVTITATVNATSVSGSQEVAVTVASVSVALSADSMFSIGDTVTATAIARDADGVEVPGVPVMFSSSSQGVASVTDDGDVIAEGNGTASISASVDGRVDGADVVVDQRAVGLAVTPGAATIAETETIQFTGSTQDARGNPISGATVAWASTETEVATVDAAGVATGDSSGMAQIVGTSGSFADTATLTVEEPTLSGDVQPILTANCALSGCHGTGGGAPQQGMFLLADSTYTYTVNVPSMELPGMMRIRPNLPDSSYLVHKIQGTQTGLDGCGGGACGAQMPFGGTPLDQAQIDLIRRWVLRGAQDN